MTLASDDLVRAPVIDPTRDPRGQHAMMAV